MTYCAAAIELGKERVQVTTREGPLEWFGGPLVASLEGHHVPLQIGKALEVARGKQLALNDREVDLDLIEPTGVNRRMNQNDAGPSDSKAVGSASTTVARTIVGNQEHTAGWPIRFPAHDLTDEVVEDRDTVLALAAAEQSGSMHVPRGKVSQRTGTRILVLNVDRAPWRWG